jgi:hypothetical protein
MGLKLSWLYKAKVESHLRVAIKSKSHGKALENIKTDYQNLETLWHL